MHEQAVFITGATGLVGYQTVLHLLAAGYPVKALVRPSSDKKQLEALASTQPLTIITGAPLEPAVTAAMAGCLAVVHCAGSVNPHAKPQEIIDTNVGMTRDALQAATKSAVRQFIHISSLSVITAQADQFDVDENAPTTHCGEAYADSKVDAEKVVAEFGAAGKIRTTVLRPGFIYGPGERAWMPRVIENIRAGKAMLIDGGNRQTNVIYVGNLCKAIELALGNERAFGRIYNLTDGDTPTKKELFDTICDGLGLPRITKSVPRVVAGTVCELVSLVAPYLSDQARKDLSRFSRAAFRLAAVNQGFSIARAEQELGYTDRVPFADAMAKTLATFPSSLTKAKPGVPVGYGTSSK